MTALVTISEIKPGTVESRWRLFVKRYPVLLFALWAVWLSAVYWVLGSMSYVPMHDNGNGCLPAKLALSHYGHLFDCWDRWSACGCDRLSDWGTRLSDLLFWILPGWAAHGLIMWLQRFTAGYFTYRLLRESAVSLLPAMYAAMTYSLFSQGAINFSWAGVTLLDGFGTAGLPFCLWVLARLKSPFGVGAYMTALGAGALFSLMCHYAMGIFILAAIPLWFAFVVPRREIAFWICIGVFLIGWTLAGLADLIPAFLNAGTSNRAQWSIDSPFRHSLQSNALLVAGILADNAFSLLLLVVGLVATKNQRKTVTSLAFCLSGCLTYVLTYPELQHVVFYRLGFLRGFQLDRIYLIIPFLLISASAFALEGISKTVRNSPGAAGCWPSWSATAGIILTVMISAWANWRILNHSGPTNFATFSSVYRQPDLQHLEAANEESDPFRVASVPGGALGLEPGFVWSYGLESADGFMQLYSQRFHGYWENVIGPVMQKDSYVHDFFHYFGACAYLFTPDSNSKTLEIEFSKYYRLELLSLANVRYIISPYLIRDSRLVLLPSSDRDKQLEWIALLRRDRIVNRMRGSFPGLPVYIYENTQALPRYYVAQTAEVLPTDEDVLKRLGQASIEALQSTAYLSKRDVGNAPIANTREPLDATVKVRTYEADKVTLDVTSDRSGILVNSTNYSPYWKATINGSNAAVIPADHTFQAVVVQAGKSRVEFEYAPPYAFWRRHGEVKGQYFANVR